MKNIFVKNILLSFIIFLSVYSQSNWYWQNPRPQGNTLTAIASLNQTAMVAVGWGGTILKTTNKGDSWEFSSVGDSVILMDVNFADALTGLAVGMSLTNIASGFMFRTTDGGATWKKVDFPSSVIFYSVSFVSSNVVVAVGAPGAAWRSSDGGLTWESRQTGTTQTLHGVSFQSSLNGYIFGSNGTMLRTNDGGMTWTPVTIPTTNILYDIQFSTPWIGMAVGSSGTILITVDGGITWFQIGFGYRSFISATLFDTLTWIITEKEGQSFRTTDIGIHWDTVHALNEIKDIALFSDGTAIGVGRDGVISRSTDAGLNWFTRVTSASFEWLSDAHFVDSTTGYAVGGSWLEKSIILKTTNSGTTWNNIESGTVNSLNGVFFVNKNVGWIVGAQDSTICKTTDGGTTWKQQNHLTTSYLNSLFFVDDQIGWAVGGNGTIVSTTNGGTIWSIQNSGSIETLVHVRFIDRSNGWIVGWNGTILMTTNGGISWQTIPSSTTESLYSIDFGSRDKGVIVGDDCTVLHTSDGGKTWPMKTIGLKGDYLHSVSFSDSITVWAAGESGNLFKSSDAGITWLKQNSNTHQTLYAICAVNNTNIWVVGRNGSILSTRSPIEIPVNVQNENKQQLGKSLSFVLCQNYPNPFNPSTTIQYSLQSTAKVKLAVYDLLGREVAVLVNEEQSAGWKKVQWSAANVSSGIYLYKLIANNFSETKKLMLLK